MPATYELISTTTLSTGATNVTFSAIPSSYTDLILITNVLVQTDGESPQLQFNSDTATNYSTIFFEGNGSSTAGFRFSNRANTETTYNIGANSSNPSVFIFHILNYSNSTTYKSMLVRFNNGSGGTYPGINATASTWRSTSAITSIKIFPGANNFNTNSTFKLYGIKAA